MARKIGILGAGTWGIALARMLAVNGSDVLVWSAIPKEVEDLARTRVHPNLPGMVLPESLRFTREIAEVCSGQDIWCLRCLRCLSAPRRPRRAPISAMAS